MKIVCDSQETATILKQMCDIALKAGGIQNLQGVVAVLNSIEVKPILEGAKRIVKFPGAGGVVGEEEQIVEEPEEPG